MRKLFSSTSKQTRQKIVGTALLVLVVIVALASAYALTTGHPISLNLAYVGVQIAPHLQPNNVTHVTNFQASNSSVRLGIVGLGARSQCPLPRLTLPLGPVDFSLLGCY